MKTLLIVEDEKMIRHGIAAMVKRSPVEVEEILECRNGVEALEILHARPIDVMFTDIKMPKMDGVELVARLEDLEHKPLVIVISGYDDFHYTVSMLQCGVKDYILKPIKREKVDEILLKLDEELKKAKENQTDQNQNFRNQIKYFLRAENIPEEEWLVAKRQFDRIYHGEPFFIAMGSSSQEPAGQSRIPLGDVEGKQVFFLTEEEKKVWMGEAMKCSGLGFSEAHVDFRECKEAWEEAARARSWAFLREKAWAAFQEVPVSGERMDISGKLQEQLLQQFPTELGGVVSQRIGKLFFEAKHTNVDQGAFLKDIQEIQTNMLGKYGSFAAGELRKAGEKEPLYWPTALEYQRAQSDWMADAWKNLREEFGENQNLSRIREAEKYIRENFDKDLNMAMVSNHVSMNYSLFSIAFKEYTGKNFVNYLKDIRIAEAKRLLETTDEKVVDISRKVGYDNDKHFMKTFKSLCGISPTEYRRNIQNLSGK